jgi:tRNA A-37 threonylcarbamoyl transferase component Bud32
MLLEEKFIDEMGITEYNCEKQFVSKKNKVRLIKTLLEDGGKQYFVVKEYSGPKNSIQREADILAGLNEMGVSAPRLYYRGERAIVMEYVSGSPLIDVMTDVEYIAQESLDYINVKGIASHLSRWLKSFYKAAARITGENIILGDISLRNFLVGYKLYGIDFEDCREGYIEEDMGRLLAFIVTYLPAFTPFKIKFAEEVYCAMEGQAHLDRDLVAAEVLKELDAIRERRDMEIPKDITKKILPGNPAR